jgi:succinate-semialdehyde dehydrogenase / glutarate-semialdehyde dehydrogenase
MIDLTDTLAQVTRKIGPALAAGCTVVLKPPAETPFTSAALVVLAERAGIPPGIINTVPAHANTKEVGSTLCESPIVKKISFTGSTRVGKILMKQAAGTLKKLSFELGGNAPFIVFDDADVEKAVEGALQCKFRSSGQTCVCTNRIYVQKGVYDKFTKSFTEQVKAFKVGSGFAEDVTHGPLINQAAVDKAHQHTDDAVERGAKILTGGKQMSDLGSNFFEHTVIGNMTREMRLAHEETFGPVAGIFPFDTEEEVIELANDTEVGLASYFYSKDVQRCYRVAEAISAGMVGINTGLVSDVAMPFGGIKESGFGREGSKHGIDEYMTFKAVTIGDV